MTKRYIFKNVNPIGSTGYDCSVCALCHINGKSWEENYKELCRVGLMVHDMPNTYDAINRYMNIHKYPVVHIPRKVNVAQFAEMHEKGKYIVYATEHLTAVIDGMIYDTKDPSRKTVITAFRVTD